MTPDRFPEPSDAGLAEYLREIGEASWEPLQTRKLRAGESVPAPELGIPGATISGTGVEVAIYPDGHEAVIIPAFGMLMDTIFRSIAFETRRPLAAWELRFVRRQLFLTQAELGDQLGLARETVSRMEGGKQVIDATVSGAARFVALLHVISSLPEGQRESLRDIMERLQQSLPESFANPAALAHTFPVATGGRVTIPTAPPA